MEKRIFRNIVSKAKNNLRLAKLYNKYKVNNFPYREYTHKYNTIFIHIPKVAGTSVLNIFMNDVQRDHLTYREFMRSSSTLFNAYYKFCFVRNPYDRMVSTYEYLKAGGDRDGDLFFEQLIEENYPTFDSFVLNYMDHSMLHDHVLFKPQYSFICDKKLEIKVDIVGRFENLEEDCNKIFANIGIKRNLPKLNTTKNRKDYNEYIRNSDVKKKIYDLYKKDFEIFDYEY